MASESSSRKSVSSRGKGVMHDPQNFFDTNSYHEFLQHQSYIDDTHPNPPLIISEPSSNPLESQSQNTHSHFEIHDDEGDDQETIDTQETRKKSDLFNVHMKKVTKSDGSLAIVCNYCSKEFKWSKSGGYGTYRRHINNIHPTEAAKSKAKGQAQISRYASANNQLFRYSDANNREELARMIAVEHLPFNFGEKVGFVNYCQKALNPSACRVPRTTLTRTLFSLYKKSKKELIQYFKNYDGRIVICSDIWSDHWQLHSYMGVTAHYIDSDWILQKRILAFRVFDQAHTADNIYIILKTIFEKYKIDNKIFAIGFDNASNNTAAIPHLITLCNPYFGGQFFHQRCACHVLNLCVQHGLVLLQDHITPIRNVLHYLWTHPQVMKK